MGQAVDMEDTMTVWTDILRVMKTFYMYIHIAKSPTQNLEKVFFDISRHINPHWPPDSGRVLNQPANGRGFSKGNARFYPSIVLAAVLYKVIYS